jgi:tetratricopeptide (TPR) repeat protein
MSKRRNYKWDVAISFAGEDRKIARKLAASLKASGLCVFYDKDHKSYLWGKSQKEFDSIYGQESRFVMPIISKHYTTSDWPRYEFSVALEESKKRQEEFILPVRLDDTRLSGLHDDINYIDLRQESISEVVRALVDKCGRRPGAVRTKLMRNKRINVLPGSTRHALGIIATSVFSLEMMRFENIFPEIQWQREVKSLRRKGLLTKQRRTLGVTKNVKNALLTDPMDVEQFNQAWVKALEPLRKHIDAALMLSLHYMHLNRFDEAVNSSADIVEGMEPDWWSNLYLTLLKGMTDKKLLLHLKPEGRSRLYNAMGLCLSYTGKYTEATRWFLKLRRHSSRRKDEWGIGQSYINCGAAHHRAGNGKKARACYLGAIEHARMNKDNLLLGHSLNNLAQIVAEDSFEEAQALVKESITAEKRAEDHSGLAVSYGTLGFLAACSGRLKQAAKWFSKSLKKAKNRNLKYFESLALFNLGNVSYEGCLFDDAHSYYRQSHKIAEKEGYMEIAELAIEGKAKAYFEKGWYRRAENNFRKLYELGVQATEDKRKLVALDGIGASLIKQEKMSEARRVLRKTLKMAQELKESELVIKSLVYMALTYGNGEFNQAALEKLEREAFSRQKSKEYLLAIELWTRCIAELIEHKEGDRISRVFENGTTCLDNLDKNHEVKIRFLAYLHWWQWQSGDYSTAIETLKNIEKIAADGRLLTDQAKAIDQRGVCLQELGQLTEAESAHKEALRVARRIGDEGCIQTSLNNLGELYRKKDRYRQSIGTFLEAEEIARTARDYESQISTAHNRALALEAEGSVDEAQQLLCRCRDRSKHLGLWREYIRSWEALGNLSWCRENQPLAARRFRKALAEAEKHRQNKLQPEIALNLARLLLCQGKSADGLGVLKPYQEGFTHLVNAYEYYGTLGQLYDEVGRIDPAKHNYELAKRYALRTGNKERVAYFCAVLAEIYEKQRQQKLSDAELKQAIANEDDPKELAHLLVQRFSLLLDSNREKAAERLFHEAMSLISRHNLSELYTGIHMILGDHNWKGSYKSKLNAMQAYIVALGNSLLCGEDVVAKIGSHIIEQLFRQPPGGFDKLTDRLERDMNQWMLEQNGMNDYTAMCLLWPLRVARKMFPYRLKPTKIESAVRRIIKEETSAVLGEIQKRTG